MSSFALNNITAPDNYTNAATLVGQGGVGLPSISRVNIDVSNGGIYWQLLLAQQIQTTDQSGSWDQEVFMATGSRSISRLGIVGVRVRAAVPAANLPAGQSQAQVTVEAVQ